MLYKFTGSLLLLGLLVVVVTGAPADDGSLDESDRPLRRVPRIIGGAPALVGMHPWAVSLQAKPKLTLWNLFKKRKKQYCGGVLIHSRWVMTAAHCLYAETDSGHVISYTDPRLWHARMASEKLNPTVIDRVKNLGARFYNMIAGDKKQQAFYHVDQLFHHPLYNPDNSEYDIALMKLKEKPELDHLEKMDIVGLPMVDKSENWPPTGKVCTAIGWGCSFVDGPISERLHAVELPILEPRECRDIYRANINLTESHEFCAGLHNGGQGVCPGDSGSPLVCMDEDDHPVLAGIVSATHRNLPADFPGIFTRVSYFTEWILSVINKNS